jgi:hypothetical protein
VNDSLPSILPVHIHIYAQIQVETHVYWYSNSASAPATSTSAKLATSGHFRATEQAQNFKLLNIIIVINSSGT